MNSCCYEDCLYVDLEYLDKLIYGSKLKISDYTEEKLNAIYFKYSCDKSAEEKIKKLLKYSEILEDIYQKLYLSGEPCLESCEPQMIIEKAKQLVGIDCEGLERQDLIIDTSAEERWVAQNPYCVSREKWEQLVYQICDSLDLELKVEKQEACDIVFNIVREEIPCDVIIALSYYTKVCDAELELTRSEEECETDFELLVEKHPNCRVDLKTYKELTLDCNMSFDIISTIIKEDLTVSVEDGCPVIVTALGTYPIDSMKFNTLLDSEKLTYLHSLGSVEKPSDYLSDPGGFVKKLSSDYR